MLKLHLNHKPTITWWIGKVWQTADRPFFRPYSFLVTAPTCENLRVPKNNLIIYSRIRASKSCPHPREKQEGTVVACIPENILWILYTVLFFSKRFESRLNDTRFTLLFIMLYRTLVPSVPSVPSQRNYGIPTPNKIHGGKS